MKKISVGLFIIIGILLASFTLKVNHIRDDFHESVDSECKLQAIIVSTAYPNDNVTAAYKGLASCTSADFATWPSTKWKFFTDGKSSIEKAIKADATNPELRYVRLMVQLNAPAFVGYSDDIDNDLDVFITQIKNYMVAASWKTFFIENLKNSDGMTSSQETKLSTLLIELNK